MYINVPEVKVPRIVIIGCGFGGLELAKQLRKTEVQIVLLDKNNYHTFQPLLYQVSTAGLEADSIAYPIRKIFKGQKNFHFRMGEVQQIVSAENKLITSIGELKYDYLVIATGSTTNYFGIKDFEQNAMPMKSVTEALDLRSLILQNFEKALLTKDLHEQEALMTFVVVGGGPTGVELAGALCELKKHVLPNDYPELDFRKMRVILIENGGELLQAMNETNRKRASIYLEELGCEVWLNTGVTKYDGTIAETKTGKQLRTSGLIWAAGIKAVLIDGLNKDSINTRGRIIIDEYCKVKGHENIFAIGDVACMVQEKYPNGHPQIAPVAIQQAQLVAKYINATAGSRGADPARNSNLKVTAGSFGSAKTLRSPNDAGSRSGDPASTSFKKFSYFDKGTMATVGRNRAVVEVAGITFGRLFGWLAWMGLHLMLLVGFRNRVVVFINWVWSYINYDRNMRLIIRPFKKKSSE